MSEEMHHFDIYLHPKSKNYNKINRLALIDAIKYTERKMIVSAETMAKIFELRNTPYKLESGRLVDACPWRAIADMFGFNSEPAAQRAYKKAKELGFKAFPLNGDPQVGQKVFSLKSHWSGDIELADRVGVVVRMNNGSKRFCSISDMSRCGNAWSVK